MSSLTNSTSVLTTVSSIAITEGDSEKLFMLPAEPNSNQSKFSKRVWWTWKEDRRKIIVVMALLFVAFAVAVIMPFTLGKVQGPQLTTLAGTGQMGFEDGPLSKASFQFPAGIAVDSAGNVFVSDSGNAAVRKISKDGQVSTLPSTFVDGNGQSQRFSRTAGLATDAAGNVYVVDSFNNATRRISPDGAVTTVATSLSLPGGVFVNGDDIFVADQLACQIKRGRIGESTNLTVYTGTLLPGQNVGRMTDGARNVAALNLPYGIFFDNVNNRLLVADTVNHAIRAVDQDGSVTTIAGGRSGDINGPALDARFDSPKDVAIKDGIIYIADTGNSKIKILKDGIVSTIAGNGVTASTDGNALEGSIANPWGLTFDLDGNLLITEALGHKIRILKL